jgi:uncharacterized protein
MTATQHPILRAAGDEATGRHAPLPLDEGVCRALLRHVVIGRLGYIWEGRPQVVPMNAAWDGEAVVVRLGDGITYRAVRTGAAVAFQADWLDEVYHQGWSVVVHGEAREVTDPDALAAIAELPLRPWASGVREHVIRITPTELTGRRIS